VLSTPNVFSVFGAPAMPSQPAMPRCRGAWAPCHTVKVALTVACLFTPSRSGGVTGNRRRGSWPQIRSGDIWGRGGQMALGS